MIIDLAINAAYGDWKTANTFENFFPTNDIHMGYMDVMAWKNMMSFSGNFQARPTKDDHVEVWYTNLHLANARDNWYRASQGGYIFSRPDNSETHIGDEIDFVWTHFFMNGMVAFQGGYSHLWPGSYIFPTTWGALQWGKIGLMPSSGSIFSQPLPYPSTHHTTLDSPLH